MARKSQSRKLMDGYGKGSGESYKPWIKVGEFGSVGTSACIRDWKNGRTVHCLSQAEEAVWYLLRWDDTNLDIREQYPLNLDVTTAIAEKYGIKHPMQGDEPIIMTTDFLVTRIDKEIAVSVKPSKPKVDHSPRTIEKLFIEKEYWKRNGVEFRLMTKDELNMETFRNIRSVTAFYNETTFPDDISIAKHLIAHKVIHTDMEKPLFFPEIVQTNRKAIDLWKSRKK